MRCIGSEIDVCREMEEKNIWKKCKNGKNQVKLRTEVRWEDEDVEPGDFTGTADWQGGPQPDLQPAGAPHQAGPPGQMDRGGDWLSLPRLQPAVLSLLRPWRLSLSSPAWSDWRQVCPVWPAAGMSQW